MQHGVTARDGVVHSLGVLEIAGVDVDLGQHVRGDVVQPAVVAARVVADECANARAVAHQPLDQRRADEATGAGDEHGAALPRAPWGFPAHVEHVSEGTPGPSGCCRSRLRR